MYAVVGCGECEALWVVGGRPETSECPRCGHRREHALRTKLYTTDDADEAREARARLLAERHDAGDAFESVSTFPERETWEAAVGEETYLSESGVDPEAVADAGERAASPRKRQSRTETVRAALCELDAPTAAEVRAYCTERDVDAAFVEAALLELEQAGEVTEQDGAYRLV